MDRIKNQGDNAMKLLKVEVEGLPLFKEKMSLDFYAAQRISKTHKMNLHRISSNMYVNPTTAIAGINASGKTSVLKILMFVFEMLNNEPINHIKTRNILGNTNKCTITSYFYSKRQMVYKLQTTIQCIGQDIESGWKYQITDEKMWEKQSLKNMTKKEMFRFSDHQIIEERNENEAFLPDDVSIMIAYHKKYAEKIEIKNMMSFTNMNVLRVTENIPASVISFLDPTVEKLYFENLEKKQIIHLKFKGKKELVLNNQKDLENYLSSGTIKGIVMFMMLINVMKKGGYLIVDEIENHYNKEIVSSIIKFFMDIRLNKNGATLIFTTHYPELLDLYERNDSIYITRNENGIYLEKLSDVLKRNDIKKSDVYQSGMLEGTTPTYSSYIALKKHIAAALED